MKCVFISLPGGSDEHTVSTEDLERSRNKVDSSSICSDSDPVTCCTSECSKNYVDTPNDVLRTSSEL